MMLLSSPRRNAWLLAVTVWLAACAGLWRVLPPAPRAVLRLANDAELIGFGPRGETALVVRRTMTAPNAVGKCDELSTIDVVAVPSGQVISTLIKDVTSLSHDQDCSPDGRLWLVTTRDLPSRELLLLDLDSLRTTTLATGNLEPAPRSINDGHYRSFSPDGKHCALFNRHAPTSHLVLWDLVDNRRIGILDRTQPPLAFSRDGRWIAVSEECGRLNRIHVIEVASLSNRATFEPPREYEFGVRDRVAVSDDGRYVGVEISDFGVPRHATDLLVWEVATGMLVSKSRRRHCEFARDCTTVISHAGEFVEWFDVANNVCTARKPISSGVTLDVGPNGRAAMTRRSHKAAHWLQAFIDRCGIPYRMSDDERLEIQFHEVNSGRPLGELSVVGTHTLWVSDESLWTMQASDNESTWRNWDIPPRQSLTHFAAGAALLALPIAFVAWRRSKRFAGDRV